MGHGAGRSLRLCSRASRRICEGERPGERPRDADRPRDGDRPRVGERSRLRSSRPRPRASS